MPSQRRINTSYHWCESFLIFLEEKKSIQSWILYLPIMRCTFMPAMSGKLRLDIDMVILNIALYFLDWLMLPRPSKPTSI